MANEIKTAQTPYKGQVPNKFNAESFADMSNLVIIPPTGEGYTIGTDNPVTRKTAITLATILPKLPAEAQLWVSTLTPVEVTATEIILRNVGAASFIDNWEYHRNHLDDIRDI